MKSDSEIRDKLVSKNSHENGLVTTKKSEWDSEHFGVEIGKLELLSFESKTSYARRRELIHKAKVEAFSHGLDVIFVRIPLNDFLTIQALEAEGAILAGVLLTFSRDVEDDFTWLAPDEEIKFMQASMKDNENLMNLAREVFRVDHFHADPQLPREKCDEVYSKWISNSLRGSADIVFVAKRDNTILGFVTCKIDIDEKGVQIGLIDLIGVKNEYRRNGVGSFLVSKSLEWFSGRVHSVLVGTQAVNVAAVRLYQRMGFRYIFSEATFHLWASSGAKD